MFAWLKSHFFCFLLLIGERADSRYVAEVDRLSADLALQREQNRRLQTQIDELVSRDGANSQNLTKT